MTSFKFAAITVLAMSAIALAAPPATAEPVTVVASRPNSDNPVRSISYRDLNLASLAGEQTLKSRLRGASKGVCFDGGFTMSDYGYDHCVRDAWNSAEPQMTAAIRRARDIAMTGKSSIPLSATAIMIHVR